MAQGRDFNSEVVRPPGLEIAAIHRSVDFIEQHLADRDFIDLCLEQANIFSAVVGMFGKRALDQLSNCEKHRHAFTAQTRFPDLSRRGAQQPLTPNDCLESKASKRNHAIQSHYNHAGWYIVWWYLVDTTESIERDRPMIIWRVDLAFLKEDDWKYEGSTAGPGAGGRTHTFGVKQPATKLRGCAVYRRSGIVTRAGKPVPANGE